MATSKQKPPKLHLPHLSLGFSALSRFSSSSRKSSKTSTPTDESHTTLGTERSSTSTGKSGPQSVPAFLFPSSEYFPRQLEKPATAHGPQQPLRSPRPRPLLRVSTPPELQPPPLPPGSRALTPSSSYASLQSAPLPSEQRLALQSPRRPLLHTPNSYTAPHSASLTGARHLRPQRSNLSLPPHSTPPLSAPSTSASLTGARHLRPQRSNLSLPPHSTPPLSAPSTPGHLLEVPFTPSLLLGVPVQQSPLLSHRSNSKTSSLASHPSDQHSSRSSIATTVSTSSHQTTNNAQTDPIPPNGAPVPVLWALDANSKFAPGYRHLVSKLGFILYDAGFTRPQFGLFRAGENREWERNPEVLAILLEAGEVDGWRAADAHVAGLCRAYFGRGVGVPEVRYWRKREGVDGAQVGRKGGGGNGKWKESWMGRPAGGERGRAGERVEFGEARIGEGAGVVDARSPVRRDVVVAGGEVSAGGNGEGVEGFTGGKEEEGEDTTGGKEEGSEGTTGGNEEEGEDTTGGKEEGGEGTADGKEVESEDSSDGREKDRGRSVRFEPVEALDVGVWVAF